MRPVNLFRTEKYKIEEKIQSNSVFRYSTLTFLFAFELPDN